LTALPDTSWKDLKIQEQSGKICSQTCPPLYEQTVLRIFATINQAIMKNLVRLTVAMALLTAAVAVPAEARQKEEKVATSIVSKTGLIKVRKDGKWGYINSAGEVIVPICYEAISDFDKFGLAKVRHDGKWGLVDRKGNVILPTVYDALDDFDKNGMARACYKGKWGCIKRNGDVVIPFEYEAIE